MIGVVQLEKARNQEVKMYKVFLCTSSWPRNSGLSDLMLEFDVGTAKFSWVCCCFQMFWLQNWIMYKIDCNYQPFCVLASRH